MPQRPTPLTLAEQNASSDDLSLQTLTPLIDFFTPPTSPHTANAPIAANTARRRSSIRYNTEARDAGLKRRPGHKARASSDLTGSKNVEAFQNNRQADDTTSEQIEPLDRPPLIRINSDSHSSVVDVPQATGFQPINFHEPFTNPRELLLRRNYFDDHSEDDRNGDNTESEISSTTDAQPGWSECGSRRGSDPEDHTLVLGYGGVHLTLTDENIRRYEAEAARVEAARHREQEEDLGVQSIPEEKPSIIPDFAFEYPTIIEPKDPARILKKSDLRKQRSFFFSLVICLNLGALMAAIFVGGTWVFVFILFIKSKDCLASLGSAVGLLTKTIYRLFVPLAPVDGKWILTLIPTYSESEEQVLKTIISLRDNDVGEHKQVMCVILDGKHREVKQHMTRVIANYRRPYVTSKFKVGELIIDAGFMEDVPVIVLEKVKNSGKKDSLILCHDLFNVMRENAPLYTKLLRKEIWTTLLPTLTGLEDFKRFDMVFCTDADSTIYKGAVASLANALARDKKAIAACGLVLVELEPGYTWSRWNLYQQFQYTFGQYVRRRAEGMYGKVTCLPGCITMIAVRPEMAGAIRKYAEPITAYPVILHQVQYLGTDRRLTYSMLSQDKKLKTLFVPEAVSETVAPQSLQHYLSQRRRWGSNAYFNNYFYCFGENMTPIMRLAACIELVRLTMVYYRIANTIMFVVGLTKKVSIMKIVPLLVISQTPTMWFMFCVFFVEKELQRRCLKLLLGFVINKAVSPFLAVTVFTKVAKNLGSQVWGLTGGANATAVPAEPTAVSLVPMTSSTAATPPTNLASSGLTASTNRHASATAVSLNEPSTTVMMETFFEGGVGEQLANLSEQELADEEVNEKLAGAEEPIPPL